MTVGQPDINLNTWGITYEVIEKDLESLAAGARPSPKKTKPKKEKKVLPKKERARKIERTPEEEAGDKERREHKEAVRQVKEGDPAKRKEIHDKYRMEDLKERTDEKRRGKETKDTKYHSYDENAPDAVVQGQATRNTGGHAVTQEAIERKREKEQKTRRDSKYLGRKTNPDKTQEYKEEKQYKQRDEPVLDPKNPKTAQGVRETQNIGNKKVKIPRHADAGDKAGHIGSPDVVPSKTISAAEVKRRAQASFPNPQAKDRPKDRVDTPAKDTREYVNQAVQKTLNGLSSLRIGLAKAKEEEAYKKFQSRLKDPSHGTLSGVSSGGGEGAVTQDKKSPLNRPVKTQVTPSGKRSGLNKPAYVPERYNKKPQGEGATGDIQAASQAKDISAEVRANVKRIKEERSGRKAPDQGTRARRSYTQGKDEVPDKVVKPELHGQKGRQYLQGEGAKEEWEKSQGRGQKYAKPPPKQSKSGHSEEYQTKRTMYLAGMSRQKRTAFNKLSAEEQRKRVMMTRGQKKKSLEQIKLELIKGKIDAMRNNKRGISTNYTEDDNPADDYDDSDDDYDDTDEWYDYDPNDAPEKMSDGSCPHCGHKPKSVSVKDIENVPSWN